MLFLALACGPTKHIVSDYTYFYQDTVYPQKVVDSLFTYKATDYTDWRYFVVVGVNGTHPVDSTLITQYVNWIELTDSTAANVSVTIFENSDTATVKSKIIKTK